MALRSVRWQSVIESSGLLMRSGRTETLCRREHGRSWLGNPCVTLDDPRLSESLEYFQRRPVPYRITFSSSSHCCCARTILSATGRTAG
ncbi:hypothetical protein MTO96_032037 [Rhipicephalus appendiculatus]